MQRNSKRNQRWQKNWIAQDPQAPRTVAHWVVAPYNQDKKRQYTQTHTGATTTEQGLCVACYREISTDPGTRRYTGKGRHLKGAPAIASVPPSLFWRGYPPSSAIYPDGSPTSTYARAPPPCTMYHACTTLPRASCTAPCARGGGSPTLVLCLFCECTYVCVGVTIHNVEQSGREYWIKGVVPCGRACPYRGQPARTAALHIPPSLWPSLLRVEQKAQCPGDLRTRGRRSSQRLPPLPRWQTPWRLAWPAGSGPHPDPNRRPWSLLHDR